MAFRVITHFLSSYSISLGKRSPISALSNVSTSLVIKTLSFFSFARLSLPFPYQVNQIPSKSEADWMPRHKSDLCDAITLSTKHDYLDYAEFDNRHWLILVTTPAVEFTSEKALFDFYIKSLASALGSEEEAKKRIYLASCKLPFGYAAEIDIATTTRLESQQCVGIIAEDLAFDIRDNNPGDIPPMQFTPVNRNHRLDNIFSYHHLYDCRPDWKYDHWLLHINRPDGEVTEEQIINHCIGILAEVLGSEKEAEKRIYVIWSKMPLGFAVECDKETSNMLMTRQDVLLVLPDYAQDAKNLYSGILVISPSSNANADLTYHFLHNGVRVHPWCRRRGAITSWALEGGIWRFGSLFLKN